MIFSIQIRLLCFIACNLQFAIDTTVQSPQGKFRLHRFRHCRKEWKELRKLLLKNIDYNDLDILYKHNWILGEWRTEPQSWIFMIVHEDENLKEIIKECKEYSI